MSKYKVLYNEGKDLVQSIRMWLGKLRRDGLISGKEMREIINEDLKRVRGLYMECHWRYIVESFEEEEG